MATARGKTKKKGKKNGQVAPPCEAGAVSSSLAEESTAGAESLNKQEASKSTYEDELAWCVAQLELGMLRDGASKSQKDQNLKNLKSLQSSKTQLPKKRLLMRNLFGDYRAKMKRQPLSALQQEKSHMDTKKAKVEAAKPKLLETVGTYYRAKTDKSSSLESDKSRNEFKFNFVV